MSERTHSKNGHRSVSAGHAAHQGTKSSSYLKKSMKPLPSLQEYGKALESMKKVPFCLRKMGMACSRYMAFVAKPSPCSSSTVHADERLSNLRSTAVCSCLRLIIIVSYWPEQEPRRALLHLFAGACL